MGYGVAIQAGTHLGKHCVVGTHSVVKGNFPDYCVLVGCPARVIKNITFKTDNGKAQIYEVKNGGFNGDYLNQK